MTQPIHPASSGVNLPTTQPTNLAIRFGGQSDLEAMILRLASIFTIDQSKIRQFPDINASLLVAAQWMYVYGAMPNRHIYMLPHNTKYTYLDAKGKEITDWRIKYTPADSYEWRNLSAQQHADERHLIIRPDTEEIIDGIVARFTKLGLTDNVHGGPYHPEDILYRARIYIEDRNARPTLPITGKRTNGHGPNLPWHYGWWKRNARFKQSENKWYPDEVPHGRTRDWQAIKRSVKSALSMEFELRPVKGWTHLDDRQRLRHIHEEIDAPTPSPSDEIFSAYPAPSTPLREEPDPSDPTNPLTMSLYA